MWEKNFYTTKKKKFVLVYSTSCDFVFFFFFFLLLPLSVVTSSSTTLLFFFFWTNFSFFKALSCVMSSATFFSLGSRITVLSSRGWSKREECFFRMPLNWRKQFQSNIFQYSDKYLNSNLFLSLRLNKDRCQSIVMQSSNRQEVSLFVDMFQTW